VTDFGEIALPDQHYGPPMRVTTSPWATNISLFRPRYRFANLDGISAQDRAEQAGNTDRKDLPIEQRVAIGGEIGTAPAGETPAMPHKGSYPHAARFSQTCLARLATLAAPTVNLEFFSAGGRFDEREASDA
jgi:hypothetical protein